MNAACSSQNACSRVSLEKSRFGPAEENARNVFFITGERQMRACIASTIRLVCDSKHNFSARVMRRGLLLRSDRFGRRQNLRHDWLDLSRVDQSRDLCEIVRIRMNGETSPAKPACLELDRVGTREQRHDDAAYLNDSIRTGDRLFAHGIEHGVPVLLNI